MDPAKMKVVDLRSELGALGLDTKGNKPALVERLKKALEERTGTAIQETTILDTSTEDVEDTPQKAAPRTRRRSSSTNKAVAPTPSKPIPEPEPIEEEQDQLYQPEQSDSDPQESNQGSDEAEVQCVDDSNKPSPIAVEDDGGDQSSSPPEPQYQEQTQSQPQEQPQPEPMITEPSQGEDDDKKDEGEPMDEVKKDNEDEERRERPLTEEEEWEQLNERLLIREEERKERERLQAEEDAKKLEEIKDNPVKLQRLKRKQEKKARWSNFYYNVAVTNEILTPPSDDALKSAQPKITDKKKEDSSDKKVTEPELDDDKVTLSWYDSDLHQYLSLPDLNSVTPLSEGAFCHVWAGTRATHGVTQGKVCFEASVDSLIHLGKKVRHGDISSTTEDSSGSGLRIGWSTEDSTLHLGDGETSWGFENTGRAVHNGEFKEYGKKLKEKDVIGCYLDLESNPCTMSYTINGVDFGTSHEFDKEVLNGRALFPHLLTRNVSYEVNLGYDRYTMMTRKKIVRRRIEVPVEQVLEEKRRREEELAKIKEEIAKKRREQREKEKREREERTKKRKEEREKRDQERKDKDKAEGKEVKEAGEDAEKTAVNQENVDEEPKENGEQPPPQEQPAENQEPAAKMEVEQPAEGGQEEKKDEQAENNDPNAPLAEVTEEQVFSGYVLDKRIKFVIRYCVDEEIDGSEATLRAGFVLMKDARTVPGPRRPSSKGECEVIMMVGLPGAGKTHWVKKHLAENPEKRYNVLSTGALFDCMKVDCKPFKATYEGRWEAMISKCAKCVLKVLEMAQGRRRNFILDQTNVYPSAQRRKLREFDGYRRVAVVVVPDEEEFEKRKQGRDLSEGKEVPDAAILDMKANFAPPEKSNLIDEIIYTDLNEEEAKVIIEKYQKEARVAGVKRGADRDRGEKDDSHGGKRARSDSKGRAREERRPRESRGTDRWGGGDNRGGSRWGDRGESRWGSGDRRGAPRGDRPQRGGFGGRDFSGGRDFGGREFGGGRDFGGREHGGGRDFGGRDQGGRDQGGRDRGGRDPRGRGAHRQDSRFSRDSRPGAVSTAAATGGSWQRGAPNRGQGRPGNGKEMSATGSNGPQAAGGQWGGQQGWGNWGWGNWNQQQQGWGNWGNWSGWGQQQGAQQQGKGGAGGNAQQSAAGAQAAWGNQQQWTAQQWYQWQQWQQQQQGWQQYQQAQGQNATSGQGQVQSQSATSAQGQAGQSTADQQALWAQYYQTYASANPGSNALTSSTTDKK